MRHVARGWLGRHASLQGYPIRVPAEIVRERLLELVVDLQSPELFLALETDSDSFVEWTCFRTGVPVGFHGTVCTIEDGIATLHLAHLAQWWQKDVYVIDGRAIPPSNRFALDLQPFVDYLDYKR